MAQEEPSCPVMLHFGLERIRILARSRWGQCATAHPDVQIFLYEGAEHGFSCDARASFHEAAAALAWAADNGSFCRTHVA